MGSDQGNTYASSGVDVAAGNQAVELIKDSVHKTFRFFPGEVLTKLGGFSGICRLPDGRIVAASTDGVGTKLMLSILLDKHDTVGIDLVAMCVNDLVVAGISPALFLDYMAMGKQVPERTSKIVSGIIAGCEQAECALIGGEMAELPGLYQPNDYDLAGFAIGFADSEDKLILGKNIRPRMYLYGLPSSGLHSNGFSLFRKIFGVYTNDPNGSLDALSVNYPELGCTLGEEVLKPTTICVQQVKQLVSRYEIHGMANITGGGLIENPPRMLPDGCGLKIDLGKWEKPPIFNLIQEKGGVALAEMLLTFNCGIGLVLVSPEDYIEGAIKIGEVIHSTEKIVVF